MLAAGLWAVSVTLMIVAGTEGAPVTLVGWSLLVGLVATLVTTWQLIERSRHKVMDYLAHQDLRVSAAVDAALRNNDRPTRIRP